MILPWHVYRQRTRTSAQRLTAESDSIAFTAVSSSARTDSIPVTLTATVTELNETPEQTTSRGAPEMSHRRARRRLTLSRQRYRTRTPRVSWNPATATESELRTVASAYSDQYPPGTPGSYDPKDVQWTYDPQFDLACTGTAAEWIAWFNQECQWAEEDGRPDAYTDLLVEDLVDPIIIVLHEGVGYIWDGNHRVGATWTRHRHHLPAIVGVPIPHSAD